MDYILVDPVVTFPAGSSPGTQLFADIVTLNDSLLEFPFEIVFIQVSPSIGQFNLELVFIPEIEEFVLFGNITGVAIEDDDG